jgi:hypothetical protein
MRDRRKSGAGLPAWAEPSTAGSRTLDVPPEVLDVLNLAAEDGPGEAAARDVALCRKHERHRVPIAGPPEGMDLNGLLMGRARPNAGRAA